MLRNIENVADDLYAYLVGLCDESTSFTLDTSNGKLEIVSYKKFDIACIYEGYEVIMVNS